MSKTTHPFNQNERQKIPLACSSTAANQIEYQLEKALLTSYPYKRFFFNSDPKQLERRQAELEKMECTLEVDIVLTHSETERVILRQE